MQAHAAGLIAILAILYIPQSGLAAGDSTDGLARQARQVLQTYCHRCHGQDGTVEGGMSYILDRDRLVARAKIVPGKAAESPLYRRVQTGKMPPPGETSRPTPAEIETIRKWIDAGAPSASASAPPRKLVTEAEVASRILTDLHRIGRRERRFIRYFSLGPQYNAGLAEEELQSYRIALTHLLNSLSWHPRITVPQAVDADRIVLRIDLRDFLWDANIWDRLLAEYPYGIAADSSAARACMVHTLTRMPVVRADWFLASACRPPLYQDLLQLPTNAAELERQLRVDVAQDIQQERVARAGFNGSGVARNNRVLERHDSMLGAYWRTYDFEAVPQNLTERDVLLPDRRNIFAYPLGPGAGDNTFQHAGGEIIFSLPNGLHGYMLVNANGVRVDKAPSAIVSDPKRPDRQVETGISCMSCHVAGINPKDDQVRDHVARNAKAFSKADAETIRALYVPAAKMRTLMDADAERYRKAVARCGGRVNVTAPIATLTLRYEADVDLPTAAAEVGLSPDEFRTRLESAGDLARNLGALRAAGGTVHRPVWVQAFPDVARAFQLGTMLPTGGTGQRLPDNTGEIDPLEGQSSPANSAAFAPDGSRALFASADKSVRLWNVEAGRDVRRFVGHTASVWAVAFSADGKLALSGSADHSVRLWEVDTGRELRRMAGHEALVAAVAFSPDRRHALSSGYDASVILWNLETGQAERTFQSEGKFPNCVAFTPDGKQALLGGDASLRLINLATGREARRFEGLTSPVTSVAFGRDGKHILSCGDDGAVRIWESATARLEHTLASHGGPVRCTALSPDGKTVLTGGADAVVRLWSVETGKELVRVGEHKQAIVAVAFSPDGALAYSCSRDAIVRTFALGVKASSSEQPSGTPRR
jgi:WD40 repeat protein/mono/diheme cytochrome c family protein